MGCFYHTLSKLVVLNCATTKSDSDGVGEDALDYTSIEAVEDFAWHAEFPQPSQEV